MDLEIIILSKSERERQIPYNITYMWNLTKKMILMDLFTKQKPTYRYHKSQNQTYVYQRKTWEKVTNWEIGINVYRLL